MHTFTRLMKKHGLEQQEMFCVSGYGMNGNALECDMNNWDQGQYVWWTATNSIGAAAAAECAVTHTVSLCRDFTIGVGSSRPKAARRTKTRYASIHTSQEDRAWLKLMLYVASLLPEAHIIWPLCSFMQVSFFPILMSSVCRKSCSFWGATKLVWGIVTDGMNT